MDEIKRRPGRPKGSETDDSVPLMAMARLILDTSIPPKTAARRVFKASGRAAHLEDASIHRWQGKWKTVGASYMQRVQAERAAAEAERQRQERAAAEAREMSRKPMWEIAADLRAAGHLPHWSLGGTAPDLFAQHRKAMQELPAWQADFKRYRQMGEMMEAQLGISKAIEEMRRNGTATVDALRTTMGTFNDPGFMETMRKYGEIGRTLKDAGVLGQSFKLPKGV